MSKLTRAALLLPALALAAGLAACGGGSDADGPRLDLIDPADPLAVSTDLVVRASTNVLRAPGSPIPTVDGPAPALVDVPDRIYAKGSNRIALQFKATSQNPLRAIYVQVEGADDYFEVAVPMSGDGTFKAGDQQDLTYEIQTPLLIGPGEYCTLTFAEDDQGRVSQPARTCTVTSLADAASKNAFDLFVATPTPDPTGRVCFNSWNWNTGGGSAGSYATPEETTIGASTSVRSGAPGSGATVDAQGRAAATLDYAVGTQQFPYLSLVGSSIYDQETETVSTRSYSPGYVTPYGNTPGSGVAYVNYTTTQIPDAEPIVNSFTVQAMFESRSTNTCTFSLRYPSVQITSTYEVRSGLLLSEVGTYNGATQSMSIVQGQVFIMPPKCPTRALSWSEGSGDDQVTCAAIVPATYAGEFAKVFDNEGNFDAKDGIGQAVFTCPFSAQWNGFPYDSVCIPAPTPTPTPTPTPSPTPTPTGTPTPG